MKYHQKALCLAISFLLFSHQSHAESSVGAYVDGDGWTVENIDKFNADTVRNASTYSQHSITTGTTFHNLPRILSQEMQYLSSHGCPTITSPQTYY